MELLYIVAVVLVSILGAGVYIGVVSAIAITVCKALLKKR